MNFEHWVLITIGAMIIVMTFWQDGYLDMMDKMQQSHITRVHAAHD